MPDTAPVLLGTSAFTAAGWPGSFYPADLPPKDFLSFYATRFQTVEVDSTYYRTPSVSTVKGWAARTPENFIFSLKAPASSLPAGREFSSLPAGCVPLRPRGDLQTSQPRGASLEAITSEKSLLDCESDFEHFVDVAGNLGKKLGPMLLQFPYFNREKFKSLPEFLARLKPFLKNLPKKKQFALEIRNKSWLAPPLIELLKENNVALALTDQAWMPPIEQWFAKFDPLTADFTYIRWLGDRKGIEQHTKVWDKTIIDRSQEMQIWVKYCRQITRKGVKIYAYANNHYAGHGPATVALFQKLWDKD